MFVPVISTLGSLLYNLFTVYELTCAHVAPPFGRLDDDDDDWLIGRWRTPRMIMSYSFRRRLDGRGRRPHLCLDQALFWPHLGLAFGLIWTSSRPHLDLITASFGPHHGLIWTSPRTHLGLIPASFQPHFNLITFVIICSWFRCSFSFSFSD